MVEGRAVASALVFRAFLPPHPALSLGERENRPPRFRQSRAPRLVAARDAGSLSQREGQGEGEGDAANQKQPNQFRKLNLNRPWIHRPGPSCGLKWAR